MELYVVGIGGGGEKGITAKALDILKKIDIITGYTVYADLVKKLFPEKEYFTTGMGGERERCAYAVEAARKGKKTAIVCSGDSGVYGMASLAHEMAAQYEDIDVVCVAGVTAALSGGALVGAPLGNDFAVISLSDYLTSWEVIEKRLKLAAQGDFVICLYNPQSKKRAGYLKKACRIVMQYRDTKTICAAAKNIDRHGEEYAVMTLKELKDYKADMFTTVFIGSSQTKEIKGKMVTPRGYKNV